MSDEPRQWLARVSTVRGQVLNKWAPFQLASSMPFKLVPAK